METHALHIRVVLHHPRVRFRVRVRVRVGHHGRMDRWAASRMGRMGTIAGWIDGHHERSLLPLLLLLLLLLLLQQGMSES